MYVKQYMAIQRKALRAGGQRMMLGTLRNWIAPIKAISDSEKEAQRERAQKLWNEPLSPTATRYKSPLD